MSGDCSVDVAVVGGGPAGVAAALAAAGAGAETLLIERDPVLGGNASQAFVHTICGLYAAAGDGGPEPLHAGFPARFCRELIRAAAAGAPERAGRVWVLPTDPIGLGRVADGLCEAATGLQCWTGTALIGARLADTPDAASQLDTDGPSGARRVRAQLVIDTSGDGNTAIAGADSEMAPPDRLQRTSFIVRLAGVETAGLEGFGRLRVTRAVAAAARNSDLPEGCESVLVRAGLAPGEAHLTLNLPPFPGRPYQPLDPEYRDALLGAARSHTEAVLALLRADQPAFAGVRVAAWPARVGVRETRRLRGRHVISADDVLSGQRNTDEVARSAWPIELWEDHRRPRFQYPEAICSVPLGALVSASHPRLGMAGRCLSASHEAHGALRVIGTALATGEAVGVAAALAADRGTALHQVAAAEVRAHIAATEAA